MVCGLRLLRIIYDRFRISIIIPRLGGIGIFPPERSAVFARRILALIRLGLNCSNIYSISKKEPSSRINVFPLICADVLRVKKCSIAFLKFSKRGG